MTKSSKFKRKEFRRKLRKRITSELSYDYQRINLRLKVGHHSGGLVSVSSEPREGSFDSNDHCRLRLNDKTSGRVMRKEGYDIINKQVRLKPQIYLRELILKKLGWKRMSPVIWQQGNNVLPPIVRKELKKRKLSLASFDKKLLNWMDNKILTEVNKMFSDYFFQFGKMPSKEKLEIHIQRAELINDELGAPDYEMAHDKNFLCRFDEVIHNEEVTYFDTTNRKHARPFPTNAGADLSSGAKRTKMIRGYCKDKSVEKVYLKSVDAEGVINRSETVFKEDALDFILGNRELFVFGKFKTLFSEQLIKLKIIRARRFYRILGYLPLKMMPNKRKVIRLAIRSNCGKYALEIIKCYFKWKTLSTGSRSILSRGAQRKMRLLANDKKLFIKMARSEYGIDKNWLREKYK